MSMDPVAADYLGGHPDADMPVMGGELVVRDGALRFSGSRIEGLTPVPLALTLPLADLTALSVVDRGMIDSARPLLQAFALAGGVGILVAASRTQRDRLLLVATGSGVASFALTVLAADRVGDAVRDARDDLPEVLEAAPGQDALLTEIRDLLTRQVELLERIAARLAP